MGLRIVLFGAVSFDHFVHLLPVEVLHRVLPLMHQSLSLFVLFHHKIPCNHLS